MQERIKLISNLKLSRALVSALCFRMSTFHRKLQGRRSEIVLLTLNSTIFREKVRKLMITNSLRKTMRIT